MNRKLADVFKTVGLPPYTYVKPPYYPEVRADIEQPGKHVLIEGPSGIGKTCVVWKAMEELSWHENQDFKYISCRDESASSIFRSFLDQDHSGQATPWPILVADDFHLLDEALKQSLGSILKRITDFQFSANSTSKLILIGIPASGTSLVSDSKDLGPRLGSYRPSRADDRDIRKLISEGENELNILFDDESILLAEIDGNFWLAQYICNKICAINEVFETCKDTTVLSYDMLTIRKRLMDELSPRYLDTVATFSKGKKWRPGGNKPYLEILLALKQIPDSVISFDRVLGAVADRRKPGIKAVRKRITSIINNPEKGVDLRKQLAFNDDNFSVEDPLFRYFLSFLDINELFSKLGIDARATDVGRVFPYDIGFSFSGETREFVEKVNQELKDEDVITFYDYDQQAFLLAQDLEKTLSRIYSESCRYYVVFLDAAYREKVWTRYERDIMTRPGRTRHIIPVIVDDEGMAGTVGIAGTIGRIDLRDAWRSHAPNSAWSREEINIIRNRCIIPLLEKLDTAEDQV